MLFPQFTRLWQWMGFHLHTNRETFVKQNNLRVLEKRLQSCLYTRRRKGQGQVIKKSRDCQVFQGRPRHFWEEHVFNYKSSLITSDS